MRGAGTLCLPDRRRGADDGAADQAGAESFKADIRGEDLSKSIVDTEAGVRSRMALRDRLMEVLETRRGTVAQLVEAERSVGVSAAVSLRKQRKPEHA